MPIGDTLDQGKNRVNRWTDLSVAATRVRVGALNKPDFDYTELGLLFPQNDTSEKVYMTMQMDHRKALGTPIHFHIHYVQTGATPPTFVCQYRFYNNGDAVPGAWTTLSTADVADGATKAAIPYVSGDMLQIGAFAYIDPPANENVSANFDVIVWRDDNDVTGDVLVKYFDSHYEIDTDGSMTEFSK